MPHTRPLSVRSLSYLERVQLASVPVCQFRRIESQSATEPDAGDLIRGGHAVDQRLAEAEQRRYLVDIHDGLALLQDFQDHDSRSSVEIVNFQVGRGARIN
jgi:hypothetical protein